MKKFNLGNLIFSSTAAVYENPQLELVSESHPRKPINPYGHSKLVIEQILQDCAQAYGLNSVCLRYFNAAGADPSGYIGENYNPETHLLPNILTSVASGGESQLKILELITLLLMAPVFEIIFM